MQYGDMKEFCEKIDGNEAVKRVLEYILYTAPNQPDGKYDLGDGIYVIVKEYNPAPADERRYETHDQYADIQVCLAGQEILYSHPLEKGMTVTEDRIEKNDVRFHVDPEPGKESALRLRPGLFALLMPEDAHKPECFDGVADCRKAIGKIPMGMFA